MTDKTPDPCGSVSSDQLGHAPRWYCLSADGMATLCNNEEDAKEVAAESWVLYPQNTPYRAAQMVDASVVAAAVDAERERCASVCDVHAAGWEANPGSNQNAGFIAASNCAYDIRKPNTGDQR